MAADEPGAMPTLQDTDVACPDCAGELDVDADRPTTDGGDDLPRPSDVEVGLRGVDVRCDRCDTDVGVYFFP